MPIADFVVSVPVYKSCRVEQIAGMYDLPAHEKTAEQFRINLAIENLDWKIGLIAGPSGSGKTSIAKRLFPDTYFNGFNWDPDRSVVDSFSPDLGIKDICSAMISVGFSSPPAWLRPYRVLSNGEKFRVDMARLLAEKKGVVVVDEFSSVVDRVVAKTGSSAIRTAIDKKTDLKLILVSCHYDIIEWLNPDWIADTKTMSFSARRRLRRPDMRVSICECGTFAWKTFARYHYLSGQLNHSARCYIAVYEGHEIAFVAILPVVGIKNAWRISRIVVLPDYQGCGIGSALCDAICKMYIQNEKRIFCKASHPAMIRHFQSSPSWKILVVQKIGGSKHGKLLAGRKTSLGRSVVSAEYIGHG